MQGRIVSIYGLGPARRIEVVLNHGDGDRRIEVHAPRDAAVVEGQTVGLSIRNFRVFAA